MSIGHGAVAKLSQADDTMVIYSYCCWNLNREDWETFRKTFDGALFIDRGTFPEPEIREKIKKTPSGRKRLVTKRVKRDVPLDALLAAGRIAVKNAGGTWHTNEAGVDCMAIRLLNRIIELYQETGAVPEDAGIYY